MNERETFLNIWRHPSAGRAGVTWTRARTGGEGLPFCIFYKLIASEHIRKYYGCSLCLNVVEHVTTPTQSITTLQICISVWSLRNSGNGDVLRISSNFFFYAVPDEQPSLAAISSSPHALLVECLKIMHRLPTFPRGSRKQACLASAFGSSALFLFSWLDLSRFAFWLRVLVRAHCTHGFLRSFLISLVFSIQR